MNGMVIVGAGQCGTRAALTLREAGWTGPITLVGAEDLAPYERPPLSKTALTATDPPGPAAIRDPAGLAAAGIEFLPGVAAVDIDRDAHRLRLADGRDLTYHRLLLTTGATPRRLPLATEAADAVHYVRTHADALALRQRLHPGARIAVVGGGFLGLELAASAVARGCLVTVIEATPHLMGRVVPAPIATIVAARHRHAGVGLRCATTVTELERQDNTLRLTLSDGDTITCDTVVAGVGAVPDTTLADKAGLAIDNGIRVDSRLITDDPDILAAGDCSCFPHPLYGDRRIRLEAWRNAEDQGAAAARTVLGADEPFTAVPWFWSDQYELTLQITGLPHAATTEVVRHRRDRVDIRFGLGPDGRLLTASAIGPGNSVAKDIRLAEKLIARRATPDPAALADPSVNLKTQYR
jgi:3-phenylpropionate/trans-cinnamate dioxygenase ferredoxin reductase subunit